NRHALALDVTGLVEPFAEARHITCVAFGRSVAEKRDHRQYRLLSACSERPSGRRTTEKRDELASPHDCSRELVPRIVQRQTSRLKEVARTPPMSALGQKQTYALQQAMSALPPIATAKADILNRSCPLCPHKRTCAVQLRMSALGQKRTLRALAMDTDCCDNLDSDAMRTTKSQIFAAVLISGTLCPTVAMAWGAGGGGGVNIPGFGALWHEPNPPEF